MDEVPLWQGNHVAIRQLVDYFARYNYLPRITDPDVLVGAIISGLALTTWRTESFAYAEGFDEEKERYNGLSCMKSLFIAPDDPGLLGKPDVADQQIEAETVPEATEEGETELLEDPSSPEQMSIALEEGPAAGTATMATPVVPEEKQMKRFHGTVELDAERTGRDAGKISEEVIAYLAAHPGAKVTVTLEITAELPDGASEHTIRTVTENARTLKFGTHGFEKE